jgi:hypothetical protein
MSTIIEREKIARRAYQIYETRGKKQGSDFDDWVKAERELASQENNKKPVGQKKSFFH